MLKFEWRRVAPTSGQRTTTFEPAARPEASVADANPDLAIRDLSTTHDCGRVSRRR
jgi:hypothetical protein